jgi:hypothetical protein
VEVKVGDDQVRLPGKVCPEWARAVKVKVYNGPQNIRWELDLRESNKRGSSLFHFGP